jgi:exodeoxyribonuclease VII large subunit
MQRALGLALERRRDRLAQNAKFLVSLSYQSVLARGFALVHGPEGVIRSAAAATAGPVTIEFADGKRQAHIGDAETRPPRRGGGGGTPGQGSLF